jgi:chemotaxis protein CheC
MKSWKWWEKLCQLKGGNVTTPLNIPLESLREMVNAGMERAASSLNMMLDSPVELEVPSVALLRQEDLVRSPDISGASPMSCVQIDFSGPVGGSAFLVFTPDSASRLVAALVRQDTPLSGMNAIMVETLNEVGNIFINSVIGTIGNILGQTFELSLPCYLEGSLRSLLKPETHPGSLTVLLLIRTRFRAEECLVDGNIFLIFEVGDIEAPLMARSPAPR